MCLVKPSRTHISFFCLMKMTTLSCWSTLCVLYLNVMFDYDYRLMCNWHKTSLLVKTTGQESKLSGIGLLKPSLGRTQLLLYSTMSTRVHCIAFRTLIACQ
jgi:hypothetical protein